MSCRDSLNGSYTFDCTNLSEVNQPHTQGSKRKNRPTHTLGQFAIFGYVVWVCRRTARRGRRGLAVGLSGVPPLLSVAYSSSAPRGKFCRSLLRGGELPRRRPSAAHTVRDTVAWPGVSSVAKFDRSRCVAPEFRVQSFRVYSSLKQQVPAIRNKLARVHAYAMSGARAHPHPTP